jgi:putative MATE family efflux protein
LSDVPTREGAVEYRAMIAIVGPYLAQAVWFALGQMIDRVMVARHSSVELAAMQIATPVVLVLYAVFAAVTVAVVVVVGRAYGAGDVERASRASRSAIVMTAIGAPILSLALYLSISPAFALFFDDVDPAVSRAASGYLRLVLPFFPLSIFELVAAGILRSAGNTVVAFFVDLFACACNAAVGLVLIFGLHGFPELGILGAGVAQVTFWVIEVVLLFGFLLSRRSPIRIRRTRSSLADMRQIVSALVPIFGERCVSMSGVLLAALYVTWLGTQAMAANQTVAATEYIPLVLTDVFGVAAKIMTAHRLGAGNPAGARRSCLGALGVALWIEGALVAILLLIPDKIIGLFTPDAAVIAAAVVPMRLMALTLPFKTIANVVRDGLQAADESRAVFVVVAISIVAGAGAGYVAAFVLGFGLAGLWVALIAEAALRAALIGFLFQRARWH